MPSPFPGMDPFLESPDWFPDLHSSLITFIKVELKSKLPATYYARSNQRVWLDVQRRSPVEPDVDVLKSTTAKSRKLRRGDSGGVAVAEPVVVKVQTIVGEPFHQSFLEVHSRRGTDDVVVAVIEILSPSNKAPDEHGRDLYITKQQEILMSPVHLVEIDLLRAGTHTAAVPHAQAVAEAGSFDYHVCVHRSDHLADFFVYPIQLESKLPIIALPLLPGDADVPLDLQAAFTRAYDGGPYDLAVRYDVAQIEPPLRADRQQWLRDRLAAGPLKVTG
jgi:Protein of unknown function (DUF4058)